MYLVPLLPYFNLKPIVTLTYYHRMHPETSDLAVTPSADNAKHKPIMVVGRKVPEKVICEICSKLVSKANYQTHLKNHEPPSMECPKCDRKFRWETSVRAHLNSAHGDTWHKCDFCEKQFKDKTNLKNHRFSHTGGGNYTCANCDSHFLRKDQYRSHMARCFR